MRKMHCVFIVTALAIVLSAASIEGLAATQIKDTESTSHGYEAAQYQVVDTYPYPGFKVVQFNLAVLSHYSYLLISDGQALVVDPGRDAAVYLETAAREGARIKGVFLTHSHADFVAGHTELAAAVGCPVYISAASGAQYAFQPLREGSTLDIGSASIRFVETPGHTPDGLCAFVYSRHNKDVPEVIFTGDTLFVGSVGRPDLMEGDVAAATLASMSFDTWTNKLSSAGDSAVIFPAHGAGSLCGAHLSDQPYSTIGAEKVSNPYFQHGSRGEFIAAVLEGLPEAPQYFKHNAAINRKGPELVDWNAPLPSPMAPDKGLTDPSRYHVVDLRDQQEYAAAHIPNAINIGLRGRLETWVGIMIPWDAKLVLCGSEAELAEALRRIRRVGYRARAITLEQWQKAGMAIARSSMMAPRELHDLMQRGETPLIVDVRLPNEWMALRIGQVLNLPLSHLADLSAKLDPSLPVVTVCNSAYRSSMAVGVLESKGFKNVSSLAGGSQAWIEAGLPVYGGDTKGAAAASAPRAPQRVIPLPERIGAADLQRLMVDLPGTYDLVDIRPVTHFADYSLPGSSNVDLADLMNNPAYLTGAGPLIIVDRDGTLAMAAGGILSQKTKRPIKVLYGGLEAYWQESELKMAVQQVVLPGPKAPPAVPEGEEGVAKPPVKAAPVEKGKPAPKPTVPKPPEPPKPPQPPAAKSAGC